MVDQRRKSKERLRPTFEWIAEGHFTYLLSYRCLLPPVHGHVRRMMTVMDARGTKNFWANLSPLMTGVGERILPDVQGNGVEWYA
jgi:hypothetical protein